MGFIPTCTRYWRERKIENKSQHYVYNSGISTKYCTLFVYFRELNKQKTRKEAIVEDIKKILALYMVVHTWKRIMNSKPA